MKIYNKENLITNKQIYKFLKLLNPSILPDKIYVIENRFELFSSLFSILLIFDEGWCNRRNKVIGVHLYNLEKVRINKQLYGLGVLAHEIAHLQGILDEDKCDKHAVNFMNNNSKKIKEIMKWRDEYEIEEF